MPDAEPLPGRRMSVPPAAATPAAAWSQSRLVPALEALLDPLSMVLSLWFLVNLVQGAVSPLALVVAVLAFALAYPGPSRMHLPPHRVVTGTLLSWLWIAGLLIGVGMVTGYLSQFPRSVVLNWLWMAPAGQLAGHWMLRAAAPHLLRLQGQPLRAVVVGMNEQGGSLADRLASASLSGVELLGFFDDRTSGRHHSHQHHRLLGRLDDIAAFVKANRVQLIYLSLPMASQPRIKSLLDDLKDTTASVYFVPDMFVTDLIQGRTDSICGLPVISVCDTPFRGADAFLKRSMDLVISCVVLLLLSPVMLAIALAVRLESPGPVIFRQRRYGLDGEKIVIYKFRSMSVTEDGDSIAQARKQDARITRLGAVLRRTSLDELPQFINVLQGRMSIVGPRPHAVAHNELYRPLIKSYMVRHKVKPGITGWAQVNGLRGETDSLEKMEMRIRYDLEYLRNWSLLWDLYIIFRTVRLVVSDAAAY
ncbi:MAG: putative sugar-phosphate transferase, rane protein [Ramlibacter sp.]|nr:putative sugar-phosphate transferase, rane protein [Ramlibacter sp.]